MSLLKLEAKLRQRESAYTQFCEWKAALCASYTEPGISPKEKARRMKAYMKANQKAIRMQEELARLREQIEWAKG